jgi:1,4-alpha-glucan branching enzyme
MSLISPVFLSPSVLPHQSAEHIIAKEVIMRKNSLGSFAIVLHAHLPYVMAHGRWPHGMDWLNEAASETYIPLLDMFSELLSEGHSPHLTLGLTPVLCEQLSDDDFKEELDHYLSEKITAAEEDHRIFGQWGRSSLADLAIWWRNHYRAIQESFRNKYRRDLLGAFKQLQDDGHLEIITCAATHGYLPLLGTDESVGFQIRVGLESYRRHFGRRPRGIWLPECAYRPGYRWSPPVKTSSLPEESPRRGIEEILSENGLEYFFVDSALLKGGESIGVYIDRFESLRRLWQQFASQYQERPEDVERTPREVYLVGSRSATNRSPVAVFARDPESGLQVWSSEWGYPGDGWYLDFHKKHYPGGHRYWRVTSSGSDLAEKEEYQPDRADGRIPENAAHFVQLVKRTLQDYHHQTGRRGILCAPFDAELFGHWWFEGPRWLRQVLRMLDEDDQIDVTTCGRHLDQAAPVEIVSLPEGSWGQGGYHYIWLNEWTEWTWKHIYEDEARFASLLTELGQNPDERLEGILKQMARELLLLEASDWQFLISTWSARDYAELRLVEHHQTFNRLANMAQRYGRGEWVDPGEWTFLGECEKRDNIFPQIQLDWFSPPLTPPSG